MRYFTEDLWSQDQDAIDFTDNDIHILANFPLSPRLRTLLLARNRINSIQPSLPNNIPNLTTLILTSNNFSELSDLDTLGKFGRLCTLSLLENPVTRKEVSYGYAVPLRVILTAGNLALSALDNMALPYSSLPRLSEGQRR